MTPARIFSAILIALALVVPASAQDNPIVKRMEQFRAAYNAGDAQSVSSFYTEKGVLLPPRSKALVGRKPIAAHYAKAFQQGVGNLRFRVLEIKQVSPEAAIEIGETQVIAGAQTIHGRYLHVWAKVDGTWSISRDMYHVLGAIK